MNPTPRLVLLLAAVLLLPAASAIAKPKGKAKSPAAVAHPNTADPAAALAPYINNVDALLALNRPAGKKAAPQLYAQAPGRIATLHQEFIAQRSKAADADHAKFDAAIATCNALTSALDERQKVLGDIQASQSVKGSGKLEQGPRKDNLEQGLHGNGTAKAVGAIVERDREKAAAKNAKKTAAAGDDALTSMSANRWNKRSVELRKKITDSYAGIK